MSDGNGKEKAEPDQHLHEVLKTVARRYDGKIDPESTLFDVVNLEEFCREHRKGSEAEYAGCFVLVPLAENAISENDEQTTGPRPGEKGYRRLNQHNFWVDTDVLVKGGFKDASYAKKFLPSSIQIRKARTAEVEEPTTDAILLQILHKVAESYGTRIDPESPVFDLVDLAEFCAENDLDGAAYERVRVMVPVDIEQIGDEKVYKVCSEVADFEKLSEYRRVGVLGGIGVRQDALTKSRIKDKGTALTEEIGLRRFPKQDYCVE